MSQPSWVVEQVRLFGERVELLTLAFIWKHKARPKLFMDDNAVGRAEGVMVCFVRPDCVEPGPLRPELLDLAEHGARAWDAWTRGLDPDRAIVTMVVGSEGINVAVRERTAADELGLLQRAYRAGAPELRRVGEHVVLDRELGGLVCGRCGAHRKIGRVPAPGEAVLATDEETAWIREHARCGARRSPDA